MNSHFGCSITLYKAEASSPPSIYITPFLKTTFEYALETQHGISVLCKGKCDHIAPELAKTEYGAGGGCCQGLGRDLCQHKEMHHPSSRPPSLAASPA